MRNFMFALCMGILTSFSAIGQDAIVKGRVVDSNSSEPIPDVEVRIQESIFSAETDAKGVFSFSDAELPQGEQILELSKTGYVTQRIPITIQSGSTVNLDPILFEIDLSEVEAQIGIISLSDNELNQDEGTAFNISGLLQASRDVFLNAAAFDFSATFFNPRGLDNANGKVLINGIEMNKQFNGRPQWGNWGGLNDAQRNRDFTMGIKANEYTFGDLAGTTNIIMRASQYRQGGRVSYAMANRSYEGRVMASYNSGLTASGWAYSVLASRRFGDEGYIDGTLYDANSFFVSVEKKLNDAHSINLSAFYTPNRRGRSTAITQEVRDLKGRTYNPNWGFQDGEIRNSRMREIEEPVVMLNHYWNISDNLRLNTNIGYQAGTIKNSRIDNNGAQLVETPDGQIFFAGGARNPLPNYYQNLPSFYLQDPTPTAIDYQNAYLAEQAFINDGQLDWESLYFGNFDANGNPMLSTYAIQNDVVEDTQITANTILGAKLSDRISLNASLNYRGLKSENYAELEDLMGGSGFLDIDTFAQAASQDAQAGESIDAAQSDLNNPNRIVGEGDRYKYNYDINADVITGFAQAQFKYNVVDFYLAGTVSQTTYQRTGLYENGNFPGARSFGDSEKLDFTNYGAKAGATYKVTGRHLVDVNAGYFTKAPTIRNSFSNARQNNDAVRDLESETIQNLDVSYIYRSPIVKARLTGFYNNIEDQTDINFFFTESAQGAQNAVNADPGQDNNAFVQEVLTGINTRRMGAELGIEAQVTPTLKLKAAGSYGQNVYTDNAQQYLTSDGFDFLQFGDGTTFIENYHVSGGPEQAYQLGIEYRDPEFWWVGLTTNYFSNAYVDVSTLRRSAAFSTAQDGLPLLNYNEDVARELLTQEQLEDYFLVNVVGGKSWKIDDYYVGFFATINNVLDQEYRTGGFEDSRISDFAQLQEENNRNRPVFGNRYFFGYGTTYYVNLYVRF
ncbi:carboxypeptidase-like regulatory domain-containing protein [Altibacter sp. HG106]|uniref:carboxypeptidase-like regulatory domain-containing protein n=1 Tax=Altibacter sp. HG106 TaxID=3023937 RepID=UPI00234FCE33|nr:carboxypeptidase-like regulatory domain-containing protein [Altibacter sp. HG106]MDC7995135.1 carboxypeptidase-like regulatory domain-containing protein [Altibacter sp. HG106]